ncbi:hypothetical protein ASF49_06265, partial [Methylobacterium sp. Leaf104]|uniref:MCP four helix bundle domain-containing protein n=2 Tax=Methylobacterium TaxID=407 RepID=UPI0006F6BA77
MSFKNLSIRARLIAAFSLLTLFAVGLGLLGLLGTQRMREQSVEIETNWLPSIRVLGEIDTVTARISAVVLRHTQATDPKLAASIEADLVRFDKMLGERRAVYEPMIATPTERALYDTYLREAANFLPVRQAIMDLSRAGQKTQAFELYESKGLPVRRAASSALEKLTALNNDGATQAQARSKAIFEQTQTLGLVAMLLALALSAASAFLIIRGVTRGIGAVVRPMQALAGGDLSATIPHQGARTEIGTIADAVQVFKDGLIRMRALEAETVQARAGAEAQRKAAMRAMAESFEGAVGGITDQRFVLPRPPRPFRAGPDPAQMRLLGDGALHVRQRGAERVAQGHQGGSWPGTRPTGTPDAAAEAETVQARAGAEAQRKAAMRAMAESFEGAVGGIISMVTSSATELQATAQSMAGTATQTANQSTSVAAAADEAASNVNTVAAAAEELGSSVQEIGRQVSNSAAMAQTAVAEAAQTATFVQTLNTAVARIGDVVTMITSIA